MKKIVRNDRVKFLKDYLNKTDGNINIKQIAKGLRLSVRHTRDVVKKIMEENPSIAKKIKQENTPTLSDDIITMDAKHEENTIKLKYKQALELIDEQSNLLHQYEFLQDSQPSPIIIPVSKLHKGTQATAVLQLSDWHCDEQVLPERVNFKNIYNPAIAEKRIKAIFQGFTKLVEILRNGYTIDTLVIAVLGDLISGHIHRELVEDNPLYPPEGVIFAEELLLGGINHILKTGKFKNIKIVLLPGNHSRLTDKITHKTRLLNSLEYIMFNHVAKAVQSTHPNIEIVIPNSTHHYINIYNNTIRLSHGDGFNYKDGIGGITIPARKYFTRLNTSYQATIDLIGHWHQFLDERDFICNGSVIGFSEFSQAKGFPYQPPMQNLILFDTKWGKSVTWPIFAEEPTWTEGQVIDQIKKNADRIAMNQ